MRAIGSSFLARLMVARDFENTEFTTAFLTSWGLTQDVDSLNEYVSRIKSSAQELVSDAFYSTFATDVAGELEKRLMGLANKEIGLLKDDPEVQTYVCFHLNPDYTNISVSIIHRHGSQSREFKLFADVEDLKEAEIESTTRKNPALSWLIDYRSPLFSADTLNNLKIYLLLERLLSREFSREDRESLKAYTRELVKKENIASDTFPVELNNESKRIVNLIKQYVNEGIVSIVVKKHYTSIGSRQMEHQILIIVTGAESFTCGIGTISWMKDGKINIRRTAIGFKTGVQDIRWLDLFSDDFINDTLRVDDLRLRYMVYLFKYRKPYGRLEKLLIDLFETFPHFTTKAYKGHVILEMRHSTTSQISKGNSSVASGFWLYNESILRLISFCAKRHITILGVFTFKGSESTSENKYSIHWEIIGERKIEPLNFPEGGMMKINTFLALDIGPKTNTKSLKSIGETVLNVVHARDIVNACV